MSQEKIDLTSVPQISGKVAIVASKWHAELVQNLIESCRSTLAAKGVGAIDVYTMPGTLEIPLGVEVLATNPSASYDAYVCLSVVVKGDTAHFDLIADSTTNALLNLSIKHQVPVINEVLAVYDVRDAEKRAAKDEFNKGIEAAAAALETIHFIRQQRAD